MGWNVFLVKDLGDFQTPDALVAKVLEAINFSGQRWSRGLEPTCGKGNFVRGLLKAPIPPREIIGYELQITHLAEAQKIRADATRIDIRQANIFDIDFRHDLRWHETGPLLVIGNPPWVTNAALGILNSNNLPEKQNIKNLRGMDARTGASNFDIAEYIWLKLIRELLHEAEITLALLCKTTTARNVLQFAYDTHLPLASASIHKIAAKLWFNADVDACLFQMQFGGSDTYHAKPKSGYDVPVYAALESTEIERVIGFVDGQLVANVADYSTRSSDSLPSILDWRQGLKHDAASIMELEYRDGKLRNKLGEAVDVEPDYVYPLLKGSDLFRQTRIQPRRSVIVTQQKVREDTTNIEYKAPKLWRYLTEHSSFFEKRKSSIYTNQPHFAMFGVGEYSFAEYKVAVAGLYKRPYFRALAAFNHRPIMLDDTCYFVPCKTPEQAALLASLLNQPEATNVINALVFTDSKRPITKKVLQRIDIFALLEQVNQQTLLVKASQEIKSLSGQRTENYWSKPLENILAGF